MDDFPPMMLFSTVRNFTPVLLLNWFFRASTGLTGAAVCALAGETVARAGAISAAARMATNRLMDDFPPVVPSDRPKGIADT
ncbi:hypothetical protein Misp01_06400 [Microtetraspora sp. NBRC 13810]|nr:hypothetical protein Misp01_06400 [Microtetraspora sp. NBRC 13810]